MKLKFKIFIISLIILILFSISFVSASSNDTLTTSDASNVLTSNEDKILTESVNNNIHTKTSNKTIIDTNDGEIQTTTVKNNFLNNNNENYSPNDGLSNKQFIDKKTNNNYKENGNDEWTYKQLINKIGSTEFGDTLVLDHNVCHNGDGDEPYISITKSIIINGQNHYISGNNEKGIYLNPKNNKTQFFTINNGKLDLSKIQVSKNINVKKVMIVTGARQAYLGQRNETSVIKV